MILPVIDRVNESDEKNDNYADHHEVLEVLIL
jgi:hypothetical protein